ncbi:MAG TPA: glutamine amidotransferase [Glaciihabitans sp.]|nr:glutamine amidotransferase [Glaciihabitans sp.]
MKPFLLLATRAEDEAADDEYAGFLDACHLTEQQLVRIRLEKAPMPPISLAEYSGIIVGGSPFNASDPLTDKTATQLRVESELGELLNVVIEEDYPFMGACYGIGLLTTHLHGIVDSTYSEPAGPVRISLTPDGVADPLFATVSESFDGFVGHKEACTRLPEGATLLASSQTCPVQAFRVGANVYATQFHPELTRTSIITRLRIYRDNGYFDPESTDSVMAAIASSEVTEPAKILRAFVSRYASEG